MNDLNEIRQRLQRDLEERVSRVTRIDDRLSQPGDEDWEERAVERENDEVLQSLGNQTVLEIQQIKHALELIAQGTYGICAACDKPISPERLDIMPYATRCAACVQNP